MVSQRAEDNTIIICAEVSLFDMFLPLFKYEKIHIDKYMISVCFAIEQGTEFTASVPIYYLVSS